MSGICTFLRARQVRLLVVAVAFAFSGCVSVDALRDPVPEMLITDATVPGYSGIRFWGDDPSAVTPEMVQEFFAQKAAAIAAEPSLKRDTAYGLTISGGGSNGAFGAGLLTGWTAHGDRPTFDVVTGISTGSLIAPFAFLGSAYDQALTEAYTTIDGSDVYQKQGILAIGATGAFTSSAPLHRIVDKYLTEQMIAEIAEEHQKGRRLLIGTTNLDAERPVIWDIGAIASSNEPGRRELIENVIVASASIPGVFPPVRIKVAADGETFDEMHVDGGTSNQVFLLPAGFKLKNVAGNRRINRKLYIIRNAHTTPTYSKVKPQLASIAGKSISSLIKTQGIGDLYRMYVAARRDGVDYNLIDIPVSFTMREKTPFDNVYMRALYKTGYDMAIDGVPWKTVPPGYDD